MTDKPVIIPIRHFAYIVEGTEYESGWGCRPDGVVAFLNEEKAVAWIKDYDKRFNNKSEVPYEYTKYSRVGFKEVSESTMGTIVSKGLVHANKVKDLL